MSYGCHILYMSWFVFVPSETFNGWTTATAKGLVGPVRLALDRLEMLPFFSQACRLEHHGLAMASGHLTYREFWGKCSGQF